MADTQVEVMNVVPVHPRDGSGPSRIEAYVQLSYLKARPLAVQVLSEDAALALAEQLLTAVRRVRKRNAER